VDQSLDRCFKYPITITHLFDNDTVTACRTGGVVPYADDMSKHFHPTALLAAVLTIVGCAGAIQIATPAYACACGAFAPTVMVQARTSGSPAVK